VIVLAPERWAIGWLHDSIVPPHVRRTRETSAAAERGWAMRRHRGPIDGNRGSLAARMGTPQAGTDTVVFAASPTPIPSCRPTDTARPPATCASPRSH